MTGKKLNCCFTRFHSLCFVDVSEITPKKDKNSLDLDHRCTHCTGESSRSDGSNNNNRSHFGFGWRHTSVTPPTKTHLRTLEAVVQVFCFYSFFQQKNKKSSQLHYNCMAKFIYFFGQIWGSFCIIKQHKCSDYVYFLAFFGLELRLNQPYESCRTPTAFVVVKLASKSLPITITVNVALQRWRKARFLAQFTMISHGATWSNWEKDGAYWISFWSSLQDENVKPLWLPLLFFTM